MDDAYAIQEQPRGFTITSRHRPPLTVTRTETGWFIPLGPPDRQRSLFPDWAPPRDLAARRPAGLDCAWITPRRLLEHVTFALVAQPEDLGDGGIPNYWRPLRAPVAIRRNLAASLGAQWQRLRTGVPPEVLAVQRAVFAATLQECWLLHEPTLYAQRFLVRDMLRYRAAATLPVLAAQWMDEQRPRPRVSDPRPLSEQLVEALVDWPRWYSPTKTAYRSLLRTLMQLPGRVPYWLLRYLPQIELERPMTDRLELITLLQAQRIVSQHPATAATAACLRLLMHATRRDIEVAMAEVSATCAEPLRPRRAADVWTFVSQLLDYPEPHHGRLRGLTRKALRWHRTVARQECDDIARELGPRTLTQSPPIPLPVIPQVTFLATVAAVCAEGQAMQHCVATYAEPAVRGECYLFHVEHQGETATVEVHPDGDIGQAYGPRNAVNRASQWGSRILRAWARGLVRQRTTRPDWRSAG